MVGRIDRKEVVSRAGWTIGIWIAFIAERNGFVAAKCDARVTGCTAKWVKVVSIDTTRTSWKPTASEAEWNSRTTRTTGLPISKRETLSTSIASIGTWAGNTVGHSVSTGSAACSIREEASNTAITWTRWACETVEVTGLALLACRVKKVAGDTVIAGNCIGAVGAVGNTGLASHETVEKETCHTLRTGGSSRTYNAITQCTGILAIIDHNIVLLVQKLAL